MFKSGQIQHIFFDLDHTLWDFETNSKDAIIELFDEFNLGNLGLKLDTFIPVYLKCNEYCWDMYRKNLMKKDLLRHQRFYLTFKDFGIIDRQLSKKMGKRYVEVSPTKTSLMPGAVDALSYLNQKYTLHIITNGFEEIQHLKLSNCKINHLFTKVITSEKVGRRKPDAKIFQYALEMAGATPSNSIMIGDDINTDVRGALQAGLFALWYNHHQHAIPPNISGILHLDELRSLL